MNARTLPPSPWFGEPTQEPERTRLQLIAAACEVAVLAALADEDLTPVGALPDAECLKHACWEHRRLALELLAPESDVRALSFEGLQHALRTFRVRLQEMQRLRLRVEDLLSETS